MIHEDVTEVEILAYYGFEMHKEEYKSNVTTIYEMYLEKTKYVTNI